MAVEKIVNENILKVETLTNALNIKWKLNCEICIQNIAQELGLSLEVLKDSKVECYLHPLPINEIDYMNDKIYLNYNQCEKELFVTFLIMYVKYCLLKKWTAMNELVFNYSFDLHNRIWLFVDLAIDSIFANSKLNQFCKAPSYKYFYNLKLDEVNVLEEFRKLYPKVRIDDFLNTLFMFVDKNYDSLMFFKRYLY